MHENQATCELVTDPEQFARYMFSDQYDVRQFTFVSDHVALVQWKHAVTQAAKTKDTNIFIGAMTTAYARLMLYDLLDKPGERCIYSDTNTQKNYHIVEFVSGGPKCYAYRTLHNKSQLKCKGITLSALNASIVTHDSSGSCVPVCET